MVSKEVAVVAAVMTEGAVMAVMTNPLLIPVFVAIFGMGVYSFFRLLQAHLDVHTQTSVTTTEDTTGQINHL
jgi:hypothetical protein